MATSKERAQFGERLRALRLGADISQDELARRLTEQGHETSGANVGAWERGQYAPRHRGTIRALEELFGASGELAPLLGLVTAASEPADLDGRLALLTPEERARVGAYIDGLIEGRGR